MRAEGAPLPPRAPYRFAGLTPVWAMAWMPDGTWWEGTGPTWRAADADARRRWRRHAHGGRDPVTVMHREYRRRLRARARRRRA